MNEFAARLSWGKRMQVVLPVVELSADGMLLGGEQSLATPERVRVELIGRMWRFAGQARVVGRSEDSLQLRVIEWDGRALERVRDFVSDRLRRLDT